MGRRILELGRVYMREGGVDAWPGLAFYVKKVRALRKCV